MKKIKLNTETEISVKNIEGFIKRKVTSFGNGAKVDCPKEYLGRKVYLILVKD